jgi:hypothetical protein
VWLQIALRPCNYPALDVQTVRIPEAELAQHINENFADEVWVVHKMNIEGVKVDRNNRIAVEESSLT